MSALHQHPGNLHQRLADSGWLGWALTKLSSFVRACSSSSRRCDQVAALGRLVDLHPAFLVIEHNLQVGRELGIGAELIDELERQVVKTPLAQTLEKLLCGSRIFGRLNTRSLREDQSKARQQEPNLHETLARHQASFVAPLRVATGVVTPANAAPPAPAR